MMTCGEMRKMLQCSCIIRSMNMCHQTDYYQWIFCHGFRHQSHNRIDIFLLLPIAVLCTPPIISCSAVCRKLKRLNIAGDFLASENDFPFELRTFSWWALWWQTGAQSGTVSVPWAGERSDRQAEEKASLLRRKGRRRIVAVFRWFLSWKDKKLLNKCNVAKVTYWICMKY